MKPKYYNTESFAAEKAEWDAKLKDSGFEDIETPGGLLATDVRTDANSVLATRGVEVESYYRMAREWLDRYQFPAELDRRIWALHCEGKTQREIARLVFSSLRPVNWSIARTNRAMLAGRPGRPVEADSLRTIGVPLFVRLNESAIMAIDALRAKWAVSRAEIVRRAVAELARRFA